MYFNLFCFFVLGVAVILLGAKGGLWDNILTWINCLFAGIIATNYFEPFADWLASNVSKDYDWYWEYLGFFLIFALSIGILRAITDQISKVRVRFRKPVEMGGSFFFAFMAGWVLVMLVTFIMHTAPLSSKAFDESFQPTEKSVNFMGLGPDRMWIGFVFNQSGESGALSIDSNHQFDTEPGLSASFVSRYGVRRVRFEKLKANAGPMPTN